MKAMYAQLVAEPFCLSMAQLARLTDRQIEEIYFHRRTKEGGIDVGAAEEAPAEAMSAGPAKPPAKGSPEEKERLWALFRQLGISREAFEKEWQLKRGKGGE